MLRARFYIAALLVVVCTSATADDAHPWHQHFEVFPAAQPSPGLKYRFSTTLTDRHAGNAALGYLRAENELRSQFKGADPPEEFEQPLDKLPKEEVRKEIERRRVWFDDLDATARCQTCDWNLPISPRMWTGPWLSDIQNSRSLARWLALKARLEILDGQYDQAARTLETGFALARHVGEAPSLISALVGQAMCGLMLDVAGDWIERPNSPNLYWALSTLSRPFTMTTKWSDEEFRFILLMYPIFNNVESPRSPAAWLSALNEQFDQLEKWQILTAGQRPNDWAMSARAFRLYPAAKRRLIAAGQSAEVVDAMPVLGVLLVDNWRTFAAYRDAVERAMLLPYSEGISQVVAAQQRQGKELEERFLPLPDYLPIFSLGWRAATRGDRKIAALRVVEAIRIYAAAHQGQPPQQLSDIHEVPVPGDPVTGRPFEYKRDKTQAVLSGPALSEDFDDSLRFEIQF